MKRLTILWQRVTVDGGTCERCGDTGGNVRQAAETLRQELAALDIEVILTEKALPPFQLGAIEESNRVFFNERPVEEILGAEVGLNHCRSCCEMLGERTDCRTLTLDGRVYEALPVELLLRAGRAAAKDM